MICHATCCNPATALAPAKVCTSRLTMLLGVTLADTAHTAVKAHCPPQDSPQGRGEKSGEWGEFRKQKDVMVKRSSDQRAATKRE